MVERDTTRLLRRWHDGDRQALGELIQSNLSWVREHVHRRLGPGLRRAGETQDFVQEAMTEVLEYGPRFEVADQDQFRRLLARIVENAMRGQHRHMHRLCRNVDREKELASDTILSLDPPRKEVTRPSQHADRNEEIAWVRLALELMAPPDREIIWLHEWEGLTFQDLGERIGITEAAARMRFQRALPRLAGKVSELQRGQLDKLLAES